MENIITNKILEWQWVVLSLVLSNILKNFLKKKIIVINQQSGGDVLIFSNQDYDQT